MSFEHPYPDYAYLGLDPDTNEKRWFGTKGMGVGYVHEDRVAEEIETAVKAERERCAKIAETAPPPDGPTHGAFDRGYMYGRREGAKAIRNQ